MYTERSKLIGILHSLNHDGLSSNTHRPTMPACQHNTISASHHNSKTVRWPATMPAIHHNGLVAKKQKSIAGHQHVGKEPHRHATIPVKHYYGLPAKQHAGVLVVSIGLNPTKVRNRP